MLGRKTVQSIPRASGAGNSPAADESLGASVAGLLAGGGAALRRSVRPRGRGRVWGPHTGLGLLILALTLIYFGCLLAPRWNGGLPQLLDPQRHFGLPGYRLLLWATTAVAFSGLLRLPPRDPEVRQNFFRFQAGAAVYGSISLESNLLRLSGPLDVFEGPGLVLFLLVTLADIAIALYWLYTIAAVSEIDSGVVAGVEDRSPTTPLAAIVGPIMGAGGLLVLPIFQLVAGREASDTYLASDASLEAATLNAVVELILVGNLAAFCLTATRRKWLTNGQALLIVLGGFFVGFYDLLIYAADEVRRLRLDTVNAAAYNLHMPELAALGVVVVLALAWLRCADPA